VKFNQGEKGPHRTLKRWCQSLSDLVVRGGEATGKKGPRKKKKEKVGRRSLRDFNRQKKCESKVETKGKKSGKKGGKRL